MGATLNGKKVVGGYMEAGTAAAPGLAFAVDPDLGFYWVSANVLGIAASQTHIGDGTAALPALAFTSDPDLGFYRIGANSMGISGALSLEEYLYHVGDPDTYMRMVSDTLYLVAGSRTYISCVEGATDYLAMHTGLNFIGDTANTKMTQGLTIQQGANDDEIVAFKSSDVGHGITTSYEADTFGSIRKAEATSGGLQIVGLKDGDGVAGHAVHVLGVLDETAADTTKSAAGIGVVTIDATLEGTNVPAVCGADENLVAIRNLTTTVFLFDAEGEMHSDAVIGVGDDWDEWDDLALASDLSRLPKAKFDEMMRYKAEDFERAGLLTLSEDEDGTRHAFLKNKALHQFAMCCFAEVAAKMKVYEAALIQLGADPKQLTAEV